MNDENLIFLPFIAFVALILIFIISESNSNIEIRDRNFQELIQSKTCFDLTINYGKVLTFEGKFSGDDEEYRAESILKEKMLVLKCD